MKEQNEKRVVSKRLQLYIALGCAAVLLALIVVVTAAAVSSGGGANELNSGTNNTQQGEQNGTGSGNGDENGGDKQPVGGETEGFLNPISGGDVLCGYGFYHNQTIGTYYVHKGVDFAAAEGTDVCAVQSGTVLEVYASDILVGGRIVIDHGNGVQTVYECVEAVDGLKAGDKVERGEVIGKVLAATGNEYKDGAHLHFEVIENGKNVDPAAYLTYEEK